MENKKHFLARSILELMMLFFLAIMAVIVLSPFASYRAAMDEVAALSFDRPNPRLWENQGR